MNEDDTLKIGRLALRQEGSFWNAYYAQPDTMEDAIFLGSVKMNIIVGNKDRQAAFKAIMQHAVGDLIEETTGIRPEWSGEVSAPEHEKAGHS